jgi:hypothetical protein
MVKGKSNYFIVRNSLEELFPVLKDIMLYYVKITNNMWAPAR